MRWKNFNAYRSRTLWCGIVYQVRRFELAQAVDGAEASIFAHEFAGRHRDGRPAAMEALVGFSENAKTYFVKEGSQNFLRAI